MFDHVTLTVYSIGWLALVARRHTMTIRKLEYQGILPTPVFDRDQVDGQFRYYTAAEIIGYAQIISQNPRPCGGALRAGGVKVAMQRTIALKQKLHLFRTELKKQIEGHKKTALIPALPNEAVLENLFLQPKGDVDLREKAVRILNRKS